MLLDEITRRTHLARFAAPGEPALGMLCVLIPSSVLALTACGTSILGGGEQRRRGGDDEQLGDRWHTVFAR